MKKLLFYSHNAYGSDTIRSALSICRFLLATIPDLTIKIITGSSLIQRLRLPQGIEYVRLPSVHAEGAEGTTKALPRSLLVDQRAGLILRQVVEFQPDLVLADKTPYGENHELLPVLAYLQAHRPQKKIALILQDIIDNPSTIQERWEKQGYFAAMEHYYDQIFVLGSPRVFDVREEYGFSAALTAKTRFLGYMRCTRGRRHGTTVRRILGLGKQDPFVMVTAGEGPGDGAFLEHFLETLASVPTHAGFTSLLALDGELSDGVQTRLRRRVAQLANVKTVVASEDPMSYMEAADLVVARSSYRAMCKILTLNKPAVVVPQRELVQDQSIRANRMARLGLLTMVNPEQLTAESLIGTIQQALKDKRRAMREAFPLPLDALPKLAEVVRTLLKLPPPYAAPPFPADHPGVFGTPSVEDRMKMLLHIMR